MDNPLIAEIKNTFGSGYWSLLRRYIYLTAYGLFKYVPSPIGDILRGAFLKLFFKRLATIWIKEGGTFHFPENIRIGASALNEFVYLNGYGGIDIGDMVMIGSGTQIISADHNFADLTRPMVSQGLEKKPIVIHDDVFIGCDVKILGGVTVHTGAVIGAGSVVTADVPENAIVTGVPAKVRGYRSGPTAAPQ